MSTMKHRGSRSARPSVGAIAAFAAGAVILFALSVTPSAVAEPSDDSSHLARPAVELPLPFIRESGERSLPDFVFEEVLGDGSRKEWGFVDLRGRPIVAVSWATWCGVCAKDLPKLKALQASLAEEPGGEKGALVAALSIDDLSPEKVAAHLEQRGLGRLRTFHDSDKMFFMTTSGVGVPSAIIADRNGRIVARAQGSVNWEDPSVIAFIRSLED